MKSTLLIVTGLAVFLLLGLSGCEHALKLVPVSGEVFVNQQPARGAMVIFRPLEAPEDAHWAAGFPRGTVDADGKFQLMTLTAADGAPAGKYVVLVTWPAGEPADESEAEVTESPPDQLGGRYASPELSPLRAEVAEQATVVPRFDLTGIAP